MQANGEPDIQRFAMHYGYLPNYVYRWANNKAQPKQETLIKLAAQLDCDPAWLWLGDYKKVRGALIVLGALLLGLVMTAPAKATPLSVVDPGHLQPWNAPYRKRRYSLSIGWAPDAQLVGWLLAA